MSLKEGTSDATIPQPWNMPTGGRDSENDLPALRAMLATDELDSPFCDVVVRFVGVEFIGGRDGVSSTGGNGSVIL